MSVKLFKQKDSQGNLIHLVWDIAKNTSSPAVLVIGQYMAEVDVELIDTPEGWSPYLSLEDAQKLDDVREALRRGDIDKAANLAHIYRITPITV
jgi:hypothetical protein